MISPDIIYYIYILLFAVYICMKIGCGTIGAGQWRVYAVACPTLLLIQGICLQVFGMDRLWMIYPLITHLPMALGLIFLLKVRWDRAILSVIISYSLCQLTRWIGLVLDHFVLSNAAGLLIHIALSQLVLILLARYCLPSVHKAITGMQKPLLSFGMLPLVYYLFEYFMLFTGRKYSEILAISEMIPTSLVLFFILFALVYQREMEKRMHAEALAGALEGRLSNIAQEIEALRMVEEKTAVHRHDLRHHLMMIDSLLASGNPAQATDYIREITRGIDEITPVRYSENEVINLLLGAFNAKAKKIGANIQAKVWLPAQLQIPDTELCTMLSNGLENALEAVGRLPGDRNIGFFCGIMQGKLLIEIKNPYSGEIIMEKGIPVSPNREHSYGCRSIHSIVCKHRGICTFAAEEGVFTLRIVLPIG